ncbi:uncharacterized protein N7477_004467 [Penicillium maclennaniae]|uniref:uncharacterized protein n=1 Tax=Penicillium maclennaniae TaxID=1343394 RepID=UPI00254074A6|nr:uncharacterized protein N7477_004467 [Penicillium maclennaniae]KAJ5674533.1 hypothetical protein N7477_004467 [Penicillium maclennaniae]
MEVFMPRGATGSLQYIQLQNPQIQSYGARELFSSLGESDDGIKESSFPLDASLHSSTETKGTIAKGVYGNKLGDFGMYEKIVEITEVEETRNMILEEA